MIALVVSAALALGSWSTGIPPVRSSSPTSGIVVIHQHCKHPGFQRPICYTTTSIKHPGFNGSPPPVKSSVQR